MFKKSGLTLSLGLGFGLVLGLLCVVGVFAINIVNELSTLNRKLYKHPFSVTRAVLSIETKVMIIHRNMKDVVLSGNEAELYKTVGLIEKLEDEILSNFEIIRMQFLGDKTMYEKAEALFRDWRPIRQEVIALVRAGRLEPAAAITKERGAAHTDKIMASLFALESFAEKMAAKFFSETNTIRGKNLTLMYAIIAAALLIGGLFSILLIRSVTKQEKNLQRSRENFRIIADYAYHWECWHNARGKLLWVNPAVLRITGYSVDECLGMTAYPRPMVLPEDHSTIDQAFAQALAGQAGSHVHLRVRHKDGRVLWVDASWNPIFGPNGQFMGFRTSAHDITKQKEAEEALRQREEQLSSLVGNIPGVVYRCLPKHPWPILFLSDGIEELSGYPKSDFLGENPLRTFGSIMHPDDIHSVLRRSAKALAEKSPYIQEYRLIDAQGRTHHVYAKGRAVYGPDGQPEYLDGTIFDITDRIKAEQALKRSEERYALVVRGANDGIWDWDLANDELYFSPRYMEILGYGPHGFPHTLEEATKRIHPDDLERIMLNDIQPCVDGEQDGYEIEFRMQHQDGSWRWVLSTGTSSKDDTGQVVRLVGMHTDITQRKAMEQQIVQAKDDAEAASCAKSEFLANMSHEIRTPLGGVIGMGELLQETPLDEQQADYLSTLLSSGRALLSVINDVLDLSKIEAGKIELDSNAFNLQSVLESTVDPLAGKAHEKNLKLLYSVQPLVPSRLIGDYGRLRQILINLAGNAVKFTESGEVAMDVALVQKTGQEAVLRFSVHDTGIGIPTGKQAAIFSAFEQADGSYTRKYGGTGLGLAISAQLVEMMGGDIRVESETGHGSTFEFTARFALESEDQAKDQGPALPQTESDPAQPEPGQKAPGGPALKILLAEDNRINQKLAIGFLERWGHVVDLAENGAMAAAAVAKNHYDLVLMDIQMPEMDGMEATGLIRRHEAEQGKRRIPIIALTAHAMSGDEQRCLEAGMDDYATKPIDWPSLKEKIDKVRAAKQI